VAGLVPTSNVQPSAGLPAGGTRCRSRSIGPPPPAPVQVEPRACTRGPEWRTRLRGIFTAKAPERPRRGLNRRGAEDAEKAAIDRVMPSMRESTTKETREKNLHLVSSCLCGSSPSLLRIFQLAARARSPFEPVLRSGDSPFFSACFAPWRFNLVPSGKRCAGVPMRPPHLRAGRFGPSVKDMCRSGRGSARRGQVHSPLAVGAAW